MRIQIHTHSDIRAVPQSFYRDERRIDIIEIMDQWYGPGYSYIKVKALDSSMYILRLDEISYQWELIMFSAARAQEYQRKYHDRKQTRSSRFVWREGLRQLGLPVGPWLREAKRAVRQGAPDTSQVCVRDGLAISLGELKQHALRTARGQKIRSRSRL
jgi:hypothetical protein